MLASNLARRKAFHFWILISAVWIITGCWYLLGPVRQEILFARLVSPQVGLDSFNNRFLVPVDCSDTSNLELHEYKPEVEAVGFCWYLLPSVRNHCGIRWKYGDGELSPFVSCAVGVKPVFVDDSAPLERPLYHRDVRLYEAFYAKANLLRPFDLKTTALIIGRNVVTLLQGPIIVLFSGWLLFRAYSLSLRRKVRAD
jgi:hypothetical protein